LNSQDARIVRALYIIECRNWHNTRVLPDLEGVRTSLSNYVPGKHWDGDRKRKSIWPTIAQRLQEQDVDFFGYVPYMFEHHHFICHPPLPNVLLSRAYIDNYQEQLEFADSKVRNSLNFSLHSLRTEYSQQQQYHSHEVPPPDPASILRLALYDYPEKQSALFRYAIATQNGFADIAEQIEIPAAREYMRAPAAHHAVWGEELLPIRMRQHLSVAYRKVLLSL
jgi:hypothetical protein